MTEKGKRSDWVERYNDTPLGELPWELGRPKEVVVDLIENAPVPKGSRVLDIGCGAGSNTIFIAEAGFSVIGLDFVPLALGHSVELAASKALNDIPFTAADATCLPFKPSVFDLVIDLGCFHCLDQTKRSDYIREVSRVIRTGGFLQLTCFNKKGETPDVANCFDEAEIHSLFSGSFDIIDTNEYEGTSRLNETKLFYTFLMRRRRP